MKKLKNNLNYSQPNFYKFSRDSIELAIIAADLEVERVFPRVLEVFAGCGVVSMEFESRHKSVDSLTFVELQEEYRKHLEINLKQLTCRHEIIINHFLNFETKRKYDIIFANPPYFDPTSSRLGQSIKRNLCRFSLNFNLKELMNKIEVLLNDQGVAYICHRDPLEKQDSRIERVGNFEDVGLFRFNLNKN